jgi:hypothetical protein
MYDNVYRPPQARSGSFDGISKPQSCNYPLVFYGFQIVVQNRSAIDFLTLQRGALPVHIRVERTVPGIPQMGTMAAQILIRTQKMIECKVSTNDARIVNAFEDKHSSYSAIQAWGHSSRFPIRTSGARLTSPPSKRTSTSQSLLPYQNIRIGRMRSFGPRRAHFWHSMARGHVGGLAVWGREHPLVTGMRPEEVDEFRDRCCTPTRASSSLRLHAPWKRPCGGARMRSGTG